MDQAIQKEKKDMVSNEDIISKLKSAQKEIRFLRQENSYQIRKIEELENRLSDYVCRQCCEEYDMSESIGECGICGYSLCDNCYDDIHSCDECNQDTCDRCISKYCDTCANIFCISCPEHDCSVIES